MKCETSTSSLLNIMQKNKHVLSTLMKSQSTLMGYNQNKLFTLSPFLDNLTYYPLSYIHLDKGRRQTLQESL